MGFGYVLSDNDESDYISVDVKKSNLVGVQFLENEQYRPCVHMKQKSLSYTMTVGRRQCFCTCNST